MHDPLLWPYIDAPSVETAEIELARLMYETLVPFVDRHVPGLFNPNERDTDWCRDAMVDTLLSMQGIIRKQRHGGEPIDDLQAYTYMTAKHAVFKVFKKMSRERLDISLDELQERHGAEMVSPGPDHADEVIRKETLRLIWQEIKAFPFHSRAILLLDWEDYAPIHMFLGLRFTTREELAELLEEDVDSVARLATGDCWDDKRIANKLGLNGDEKIKAAKVTKRKHQLKVMLIKKLNHPGTGDVSGA